MTPKLRAKLKKALGYPAVFLGAFLLFFYLTFPYAALERFVVETGKANGMSVKIGSMGPGLFGATAKQVRVAPLIPGVDDPPGVVIDSVAMRPALFPPGLAIRARSFGGKASGNLGLLGRRNSVKLTASGVDLAKARLKEAVGLDAGGIIGGRAVLDLDPVDVAKAKGEVEFAAENVIVNGGTVQNIDLPRVAVGQIEGLMKVEAGKATVEHFTVKGDDIEAEGEGEITLHPRLAYSSPRLKIRFKPAAAWLDKFAIVKSGLAFAGTPDAKGFYTLFLEGLVGNPRPRLQR